MKKLKSDECWICRRSMDELNNIENINGFDSNDIFKVKHIQAFDEICVCPICYHLIERISITQFCYNIWDESELKEPDYDSDAETYLEVFIKNIIKKLKLRFN